MLEHVNEQKIQLLIGQSYFINWSSWNGHESWSLLLAANGQTNAINAQNYSLAVKQIIRFNMLLIKKKTCLDQIIINLKNICLHRNLKYKKQKFHRVDLIIFVGFKCQATIELNQKILEVQ